MIGNKCRNNRRALWSGDPPPYAIGSDVGVGCEATCYYKQGNTLSLNAMPGMPGGLGNWNLPDFRGPVYFCRWEVGTDIYGRPVFEWPKLKHIWLQAARQILAYGILSGQLDKQHCICGPSVLLAIHGEGTCSDWFTFNGFEKSHYERITGVVTTSSQAYLPKNYPGTATLPTGWGENCPRMEPYVECFLLLAREHFSNEGLTMRTSHDGWNKGTRLFKHLFNRLPNVAFIPSNYQLYGANVTLSYKIIRKEISLGRS